jgi:hypothetical protein
LKDDGLCEFTPAALPEQIPDEKGFVRANVIPFQARTIMRFCSRSVQAKDISSLQELRPRKPKGRGLSLCFVFLPALLFFCGSKLLADGKPVGRRTTQKIRTIVDRFRQDLSIRERVHISIVARNEKLVSVERSKNALGEFILSFDENFLSSLDDSELSASIARTWTCLEFSPITLPSDRTPGESDCSESRDQGEIGKGLREVWKDKGKGDLIEFLGEDTAVGLKPEIRVKSLPKTTDGLTNK